MGPLTARRAAPVVGLALVVSVLIAAPVFAYSSRAAKTVVIPKRAKGAATATCPKGQHVGFGGVVAQVKAPYGSGALVFPTGMRRTANNKFTAYGQSGAMSTGSRLTAIAYCVKGTAAPRAVAKTVTLPGRTFRTAVATCPAGTIVVGGGYNSGASLDHAEVVFGLQAGANPREWGVTLGNIETGATKLTAYAYCAPGVAPTAYTKTVPVAAKKAGTAHVSCPTGTTLLFGGLYTSSPSSGSKFASVAAFSWTASNTKQWNVSAHNVGTLAGYLTAVAYCR